VLPATRVTAEYAPGRVIDLPTPYGAPVCDVGIQPVGARITVVRPGRGAAEVRVPLAGDVLTRIHEEECAVQAVAETVGIAVTGLHDDGDALAGELRLTRRAGREPVTARQLSRSVLLEANAPELPVELGADQDAVAVPVAFTPASCDSHVLAEIKQPYVFPLLVLVGDGAEVPVDLPLDRVARNRLAALVYRVCTPAG
jgi:hypothetical protein